MTVLDLMAVMKGETCRPYLTVRILVEEVLCEMWSPQ